MPTHIEQADSFYMSVQTHVSVEVAHTHLSLTDLDLTTQIGQFPCSDNYR
jgi:hypothetical protein